MDLTNEQLAEALRRADALAQQGDEQARLDAIALSQEYQKRVSQPTEVTTEEPLLEDGPSGFMPFLNKSIATAFGAPVDITNAALNLVGLGTDRPIGGSKSIRQAMGVAGIETPERAAETFAERAGQVGGELASFMIPGAAATKALSQIPVTAGSRLQTVGRLATQMQKEMIERPGRALTAETLAVPGIAAARTVAEEKEFTPTQQMLAEIAGGVIST
jgi:hypothetical protein